LHELHNRAIEEEEEKSTKRQANSACERKKTRKICSYIEQSHLELLNLFIERVVKRKEKK
jgi:23S rRNA maturation mini-RNase III